MRPIGEIKLGPLVESNALTITGRERVLSDSELQHLVSLCRQMQAYYPHQEFARETVDGYLFDFERLAVMHGLDRLEQAFLNLRVRRGQKFFPHPTEVAEEIEATMDADRAARESEIRARKRQREIAEFWKQAPDWMELTGNGEAELLRRFPSFRGTKPTEQPAPSEIHVVPIDRKMAAAGDY
jgi:hypothetical protein